MAGLSKSRILLNQQCSKRLWLKTNRPELEEVSEGNERRFAAGDKVGEIARGLYPGGLLIDADDLGLALEQTRTAMAGPPRPLFEATFEHEGTLVRADLLLPDNGAWRMVEVKSSTSVKDYHLNDAAVQAWVLEKAGVLVSRVEIAHIDNTFVYPGNGDYRGLLTHEGISQEVRTLQADVPVWLDQARQTLGLGTEPDIVPGKHCDDPFECSFRRYCDPSVFDPIPVHSVRVLPYGGKFVQGLIEQGREDLRQLRMDELKKENHQRIWRTLQTGQAELDPRAGKIVGELGWPRYYMDFETINPAVPQWAGTRPYQHVPFQWSCHIERPEGLEHAAFLAEAGIDPRRPFIESLLATLGDTGPVLVYNAPFERGRLEDLADAFPDLAAPINKVIKRLFDLYPLSREHYYHPDMRGSWSIKALLPTIAPELSYDGMTVAHGGAAQEAYEEIIAPVTTQERRAELAQALLEYCERDTLAMVEIARYYLQGERSHGR
jgi:hypothetical protein